MLNARIKCTLLTLILLGIFLLNTDYTDADLFAERDVRNNRFSATVINFFVKNSINGGNISDLYKTVGMTVGGYDLAAIKLKREGNVQFKYRLKAIKTNGEDALCDNLNVRVLRKDFSQIFSDKLSNVSIDSQITTDDPVDYIFFVSLDQNDVQLKNKICEFNFTFRTYKTDPNETGGIFAERTVKNVVSSGTWQ